MENHSVDGNYSMHTGGSPYYDHIVFDLDEMYDLALYNNRSSCANPSTSDANNTSTSEIHVNYDKLGQISVMLHNMIKLKEFDGKHAEETETRFVGKSVALEPFCESIFNLGNQQYTPNRRKQKSKRPY